MAFWDKLFGLDKPTPKKTEKTALLTTLHGYEEETALRALLDGTDIPYIMQRRGAGEAVNVITGFTIYGTDVFVPADRLEEAKALLEGNGEEIDESENEQPAEDPELEDTVETDGSEK